MSRDHRRSTVRSVSKRGLLGRLQPVGVNRTAPCPCPFTCSSFLLPKTDAAGTPETWKPRTRLHGVNTVAYNRNVTIRICEVSGSNWSQDTKASHEYFLGPWPGSGGRSPTVVVETRLQTQVSPCKICGGQSATSTGSSASTWV